MDVNNTYFVYEHPRTLNPGPVLSIWSLHSCSYVGLGVWRLSRSCFQYVSLLYTAPSGPIQKTLKVLWCWRRRNFVTGQKVPMPRPSPNFPRPWLL